MTNVLCGNCLDILGSHHRSNFVYSIYIYMYLLIIALFFSFSLMPICALFRSTIRRSSWSPMDSYRCVSACIERPVPRTLSCLPIIINSVIYARSFSVTSPVIYPGHWCHSKTSRKCCNHPRCPCPNPLARCWKVRLTILNSVMISIKVTYLYLLELNETSVEDNDFYIRESRDMVTVIQNLLQAGKDRR